MDLDPSGDATVFCSHEFNNAEPQHKAGAGAGRNSTSRTDMSVVQDSGALNTYLTQVYSTTMAPRPLAMGMVHNPEAGFEGRRPLIFDVEPNSSAW